LPSCQNIRGKALSTGHTAFSVDASKTSPFLITQPQRHAVADVGEGIGVEHDQVGELARLDSTQILEKAQVVGPVPSRVSKVTVLASGMGVLIRLPTSAGFGGGVAGFFWAASVVSPRAIESVSAVRIRVIGS
jgi:hypothetical protein